MVLLRATQKVLRSLPPAVDEARPSDTALGDWFVNRLVVDRRPLLVLVSSASLLSVVLPAREVRALPDRLPDEVAKRLMRLGVSHDLILREIRSMDPVKVARTNNRSVLGSLNDFAKSVPYYLPEGGWSDTALFAVEAKLARTPCRVGRRAHETIWPEKAAPKLLEARWASDAQSRLAN